VLFDVDGTLVDSNYLHTMAWRRAFVEVGVDVETWRIHRASYRPTFEHRANRQSAQQPST
jgi:beta-phosphoglucomutase-like phosphatase (HAD superfamily)